jgi:hypothetical protein
MHQERAAAAQTFLGKTEVTMDHGTHNVALAEPPEAPPVFAGALDAPETLDVAPAPAGQPRVRSPRVRRSLIAAAAALLVFAGATVVLVRLALRAPVEQAPATSGEPHSEDLAPAIAPTLTAAELVKAGQAAMATHDWLRAEELLSEARLRAADADIDTQLAIFERLAHIADALEKTHLAAAHRKAVEHLRSGLGSAVLEFTKGEALMATGELPEARRAFARFLLRSNEVSGAAAHYLVHARINLAEIARRTADRIAPPVESDGIEPEAYFVH